MFGMTWPEVAEWLAGPGDRKLGHRGPYRLLNRLLHRTDDLPDAWRVFGGAVTRARAALLRRGYLGDDGRLTGAGREAVRGVKAGAPVAAGGFDDDLSNFIVPAGGWGDVDAIVKRVEDLA